MPKDKKKTTGRSRQSLERSREASVFGDTRTRNQKEADKAAMSETRRRSGLKQGPTMSRESSKLRNTRKAIEAETRKKKGR